jgi:polyhydroxyalkanoate synthase
MTKPPKKPADSAAKRPPAAKALVKAAAAKAVTAKAASKASAKPKAMPVKTEATASKPSVAKPKAATPEAAPRPAAPPRPQSAPSAAPPAAGFDPDTMRNLEALSLNIAKATMTAQSALAKTVFSAEATGAVQADPFQVAPAMTEIMSSLAANPNTLLEAQSDLMMGFLQLWGDVSRRTLGSESGTDAPDASLPAGKKGGDKRFADPRWEQNLVFDVMKQSYLLSSNWINKLISSLKRDPIAIGPARSKKFSISIYIKTYEHASTGYGNANERQ